MSEKMKSKEDKIENAVEYITYAKDNIEGILPSVAEELEFIRDTLEEELRCEL